VFYKILKAIFLSDIHIGIHKNSDIWLNQSINLFHTIHDKCVKENISNIFILGDLFHERKTLNIQTMCIVMEMMNELKNLNVYLLLGNHDTYYKNITWPYSPYLFEKMNHVKIIDRPTIVENITFLPWSTSPYDLSKYDTPILAGHFEIDGFPATCTDLFKGGRSSKDFEKFEIVLSGHFHIPCKKGNILYCGSPFHLTMSDRGSKCGYYILDDKNITFVENTEYAKYLRITTEDKVTKKQIEGNIVDLLYTKDYGSLGNVRKLEYIQSMNPLRVSSNFTNALNYNNVETSKEMDISSKSNEDILREYINVISIPKHIKKNALNSIIERFIKEIKDKSPL